MKKYFLNSLLIGAAIFSIDANAQLSLGGIPQSIQQSVEFGEIPTTNLVLPNWSEVQASYYAGSGNKPLLISAHVAADISFPQSGVFKYLDDGSIIWTTKVYIPNAPAIGLLYDQFKLPKGVKYFIKSGNGNQILGAYNETNNNSENVFITEPTVGDVAYVELNIAAGVAIENIKFNINKASVYFEGISYLANYIKPNVQLITGTDPDPYNLEGAGSQCMINAACPAGTGYENSRKSTVQTMIPTSQGMGICSATLLNAASNNTESCKAFVLLASHCDFEGDADTDAEFATWQVRFNFERDSCTGGTPAKQNTMNGLFYRTRSVFSSNTNIQNMKEDFMLLELRQAIPDAYNATLSGWDRTSSLASTPASGKYIGFHHPSGDVKKVSYATSAYNIDNDFVTLFNQSNYQTQGGWAQGSSGSGLHNANGVLVGVASTAGNEIVSCKNNNSQIGGGEFLNYINYSRFSKQWDFVTPKGPEVKTFLDPNNTNAITLNAVTSACKPLDGGNGGGNAVFDINNLENQISIYPIPSTTGTVNVAFNLAEAKKIELSIIDITGKIIETKNLQKIQSETIVLDVSKLNNGIYLIKINDGLQFITKKIAIQ